MKNLFTQAISIILGFFILLALLMQVNWMALFSVEKTKDSLEEKLGTILWETVINSEKEIKSHDLSIGLDSVLNVLYEANNIKKDEISVHVFESNEINAFALPGGKVVVYSGLLQNCKDVHEFTGVLAHEIAHLQLNHIMQSLAKEFGLSVLLSVGSGNGTPVSELVHQLSSKAFDREMEREADEKSVEYMVKAKINAEGLANFLYRMSQQESKLVKYLEWINTHPDSEERAKDIIAIAIESQKEIKDPVSQLTWNAMIEDL